MSDAHSLSDRLSRFVWTVIPEHQTTFKTFMSELRAMEKRHALSRRMVWFRRGKSGGLFNLIDIAKDERGADLAIINNWEGDTLAIPWSRFLSEFTLDHEANKET